MKKSKLSIGLMAALLSFATLTGCDGDLVKFSPEGAIISYYLGDEHKTIKADDLFEKLIDESDDAKYQTIFDKLKSIIIRNYFYTDVNEINPDKKKADGSAWKMGVDDLPQLEINAQNEVEKAKETAQNNAATNKTSYEDELDTILGSKGLKEKTLEAYYQQCLEDEMEEKFYDNFYKYCREELSSGIKDGVPGTEGYEKKHELYEYLKDYWTGYFTEAAPYHVSHILVKLSDSSESNYSNGKISEKDANNLYKVVNELAEGKKDFAQIALSKKDESENEFDTGSAASFGDLGIMDYNTTFIPEFQLGIFAYENLIGKYSASAQANNSISIPDILSSEGIATELKDEMNEAFSNETITQIPSVSFSIFEDLRRLSDATESTNSEKVMNGNEIVFPRNTIYNRYLNRHSYAFITGGTDKTLNEGFTGFHTYSESEYASTPLAGQTVLSIKTADGYSPIIMVRGGNDSGNTYHGIHFIVINRSYFCEDANGVTRDEYYTTYNVDQNNYPHTTDTDSQPKKTYVNFNRYDSSDENTAGRAEEVLNKFKDFNSTKLNRYIFKKYMKLEGIKIDDISVEGKHIAYGLEKWINDQIAQEKNDFTMGKKEKWTNYVSMLRKQNDIRTRLISPAASIVFDEKANGGNGFKLTDEITKAEFEAYCDLIGLTNADTVSASAKIGSFFADYYGNSWDWSNNGKVKIEDLYNVKGALFNDGNTYNK